MLECTHLYNLCFCAEMKKFKCDNNEYKHKKQKGGMVMIVAEQKSDNSLAMKKEFRTSVTVFKDDFDIFKDICKAKYDKDPVNSGVKEAIAAFIRENKQYLEPKYSQMKEWFE